MQQENMWRERRTFYTSCCPDEEKNVEVDFKGCRLKRVVNTINFSVFLGRALNTHLEQKSDSALQDY